MKILFSQIMNSFIHVCYFETNLLPVVWVLKSELLLTNQANRLFIKLDVAIQSKIYN